MRTIWPLKWAFRAGVSARLKLPENRPVAALSVEMEVLLMGVSMVTMWLSEMAMGCSNSRSLSPPKVKASLAALVGRLMTRWLGAGAG